MKISGNNLSAQKQEEHENTFFRNRSTDYTYSFFKTALHDDLHMLSTIFDSMRGYEQLMADTLHGTAHHDAKSVQDVYCCLGRMDPTKQDKYVRIDGSAFPEGVEMTRFTLSEVQKGMFRGWEDRGCSNPYVVRWNVLIARCCDQSSGRDAVTKRATTIIETFGNSARLALLEHTAENT